MTLEDNKENRINAVTMLSKAQEHLFNTDKHPRKPETYEANTLIASLIRLILGWR